MQPGARLGPYEIVASIGAGGMGEVHLLTTLRRSLHVGCATLVLVLSLVALRPTAAGTNPATRTGSEPLSAASPTPVGQDGAIASVESIVRTHVRFPQGQRDFFPPGL